MIYKLKMFAKLLMIQRFKNYANKNIVKIALIKISVINLASHICKNNKIIKKVIK